MARLHSNFGLQLKWWKTRPSNDCVSMLSAADITPTDPDLVPGYRAVMCQNWAKMQQCSGPKYKLKLSCYNGHYCPLGVQYAVMPWGGSQAKLPELLVTIHHSCHDIAFPQFHCKPRNLTWLDWLPAMALARQPIKGNESGSWWSWDGCHGLGCAPKQWWYPSCYPDNQHFL